MMNSNIEPYINQIDTFKIKNYLILSGLILFTFLPFIIIVKNPQSKLPKVSLLGQITVKQPTPTPHIIEITATPTQKPTPTEIVPTKPISIPTKSLPPIPTHSIPSQNIDVTPTAIYNPVHNTPTPNAGNNQDVTLIPSSPSPTQEISTIPSPLITQEVSLTPSESPSPSPETTSIPGPTDPSPTTGLTPM